MEFGLGTSLTITSAILGIAWTVVRLKESTESNKDDKTQLLIIKSTSELSEQKAVLNEKVVELQKDIAEVKVDINVINDKIDRMNNLLFRFLRKKDVE